MTCILYTTDLCKAIMEILSTNYDSPRRISAQSLAAVSTLACLTYLNLSDVMAEKSDAGWLRNLVVLRELHLARTPIMGAFDNNYP